MNALVNSSNESWKLNGSMILNFAIDFMKLAIILAIFNLSLLFSLKFLAYFIIVKVYFITNWFGILVAFTSLITTSIEFMLNSVF